MHIINANNFLVSLPAKQTMTLVFATILTPCLQAMMQYQQHIQQASAVPVQRQQEPHYLTPKSGNSPFTVPSHFAFP